MRTPCASAIVSSAMAMRCCFAGPPDMLEFQLLKSEGLARRGRMTLTHGVVETPVFMPVGTYGTVKGVMPSSLEAMGAQIILGNTFHLWLRPGLDVLQQFGGLHRFENWLRPIPTDSR